MTYQVQLPIFAGPLDLLLHLIERAEIDIYDIPIAAITEQFLSYLRTMEILNLEIAGEFLVMAATLMQIKAKMLLPRPAAEEQEEGEEEEDPRQELVDRLLAYRRVKEAAAVLRRREEESLLRYPRGGGGVDETTTPPPALAPGLSLWDLLEAFQQVLAQAEEGDLDLPLPEEKVTVREAMVEILARLEAEGATEFERIFTGRRSRRALVVAFVALLELIRLGRVMAYQETAFGRISLRLRTPPEEGPR